MSRIEQLGQEKDLAVRRGDYERGFELQQQQNRLSAQVNELFQRLIDEHEEKEKNETV